MINRLVIIGVGSIGGSLARALKKSQFVSEIVGCGRDKKHLQTAVDLGVIDTYETDIVAAIRDADIIVICAPVCSILDVLEKISGGLSASTIVTDVGSTKMSVIEAAQSVFGDVPPNFVPGHPIAGTEKSGVTASVADLFQGRRVILTPVKNTQAAAIHRVREMWQQTGAIVSEMDAVHHDEVLAATSHLPHLLAYVLVDTLARMEDKPEIFQYAAGGFKDFTRIASSDPQMWHDICLENSEPIIAMIDKYEVELKKIREAVANHDSNYIKRIFTRAKLARDDFCNNSEL